MLNLEQNLLKAWNSNREQNAAYEFSDFCYVALDMFTELGLDDTMVCQPLRMEFFVAVEKIIIDKMLAYAKMDINGIESANIAFNLARTQLHEWRNLYEGAVFVNGMLEEIHNEESSTYFS